MLLAVDLGKTSCRAVVHGNPERSGGDIRPVIVAGAPGLAAPGGVRAAERAVLAAAEALGLDGVDEVVVGAAGALAAPGGARELVGAELLELLAGRRRLGVGPGGRVSVTEE
jgi:N-acetylmuramic acid 6-phosphate etherase